jgi:hypothetical protein
MEKTYSFLKDELVLQEIRKHKWLESEKAGYEIGFASAAYDWICRFGNDYLNHQISLSQERMHILQDALIERKSSGSRTPASSRR